MDKNFKIDRYKFYIGENGYGLVEDLYNGKFIELNVFAMKKMIEVYEKEFLDGKKIESINEHCDLNESMKHFLISWSYEEENNL